MTFSINTNWIHHSRTGTVVHGYELSDVYANYADLIRRVIEARRDMEADRNSRYSLNCESIKDIVHRDQDRFSLRRDHDHRHRENMRRALIRGCLRLYGQRWDLTPGVDRQNAMGHYPSGIKADYMFGTPFFDDVLEDHGKHGYKPRILFLEEGVEVRVWKRQPAEPLAGTYDQSKPPPHLRNVFMWANFKTGEGGYDVIAIPYGVLTESAKFSGEHLRRADKENPVFNWLRRDIRATNHAYREMESEARAVAEFNERETFLRLLKKFGPSLANGTWKPDMSAVKDLTYYDYQGFSEWELGPDEEK